MGSNDAECSQAADDDYGLGRRQGVRIETLDGTIGMKVEPGPCLSKRLQIWWHELRPVGSGSAHSVPLANIDKMSKRSFTD